MGWSRLEWIGVGWSGLEWVGVGWSGLEWVGVQFDKARLVLLIKKSLYSLSEMLENKLLVNFSNY